MDKECIGLNISRSTQFEKNLACIPIFGMFELN
jgi:hypothetical protein